MKQKKIIWLYPLIIVGLILILTIGCMKDEDKTNDLTTGQVPVLTTTVSGVAVTIATCGGNITSDGGAAIIARGVCWSTSQNPTIANSKTSDGSGTGTYTSSITGLSPNTTCYVRAYATNSIGTSYGNELTLKTYTGTVTDIDGNIYYTVTIGTQIWMAENLKTTKLNDNTPIPLVTDDAIWGTTTTSGYCFYNNDISNKDVYGALYNHYAVKTGKLAPIGWHVPTDNQWTTLTTFLGGEGIAGGKLKEIGTSHWITPNSSATNETMFSALPGGERTSSGVSFKFIKKYGHWWSSTEDNTYGDEAIYRYACYDKADLVRCNPLDKHYGLSVRCVKD